VGNVIKSQIVAKDSGNRLNYKTWIAGNSSATGFSANGGAGENILVNGLDPWGNETVLWLSLPSGDGNNDGGWNTSNFSIDNTKLYRFSVWVKRTVYVNGAFYLGTRGFGSTNGVLNRSNGANNTNPYFWISSDPPTTAQLPDSTWVLVVAHVWPADSGTGTNKPESGRYTISGGRYGDISTDFVWRTETTLSNHRSYLFYSESNLPRQYWCYPRVDIVDGTEPSIGELLGGYGALSSVSLQKSNFLLGPSDTTSYYPTSEGGYWNGILPASGGYTIYLGSPATAGVNPSAPVIYTASNDNDLTTVSGVIFGNSFSSASDVLSWAAPQNNILIVNREYESLVTSGLTLNLDAGFSPSYPKTGTTWYDVSGNFLNGTLTVSPIFSGSEGGILDFDGTDDWVEISTYTFGIGNWSVNIWASGDSITYGTTGNLVSNSSGGPVTNAMGFVGGKIHYRNYDGTWKSNSGNTTLSTGTWYMLTWVNYVGNSSSCTMKMYVNGIADSSVFNSFTTNGGPCNSIGRNWFDYYNGKIGLVQFYNISLTDAQVLSNFNAYKSRFGVT